MPELPKVETVMRGLAAVLEGQTIALAEQVGQRVLPLARAAAEGSAD